MRGSNTSRARARRIALGVLSAVATTLNVACDERVPLGSWDQQAPGNGQSSGSSGLGGQAGAPTEGGSAGLDSGEVHACQAPGNPQPLNDPGDLVDVTTTYTDWTFPSPIDSLEWTLEIESELASDGYFWSHQFGFTGDRSVIAFVGLQARGGFQPDPPFGPATITDMVVFWISSSLEAELGDTSYPDARTYQQVDSEREWWTIHVRYDLQVCRPYALRVGRLTADGTDDIWYGAWIRDVELGSETFLGRILVPASWGRIAARTSMWSSRIGWGSLTSCSDSEPAMAFFGAPTAENGTVRPGTPVNRFSASLGCPSSRFTPFADGVRQELGAR